MENKQYKAIFYAILAAALYAISSPISKILLKEVPPTMMASLLYLGAGTGSLIIAIAAGEKTNNISFIIVALILGFFAYGLSIFFYIYAQRDLGAAKTSAYYAISPFIGVGLSLLIFREIPTASFISYS
ncbi:MAG: permease of the drug/metabolite transporter superfamily [Sedimentibacter sp.]|nr:permease of the drug/metabolite transporter superfamily [Sedimentibacter sp.]